MAEANLTLAIIALIEGAPLARCTAAALREASRVMIVRRDGSVVDSDGRQMGRSEGSDVPSRRRRAAELADTDYIGFLEDTVVPSNGWGAAVCRALARRGAAAAGGPVSIDPGLPPASQALALTEYGRYTAIRAIQAVKALPGCNFAFRRTSLLQVLPPDGLIDNAVFDELACAGFLLMWAPDMMVTYCAPNPEGARLATRFSHGRLYAGQHLRDRGAMAKTLGATKALLLPVVLMSRTLRESHSAQRSPVTLGHAVLQHTAWAAGEFAGALFGPPRGGSSAWQ